MKIAIIGAGIGGLTLAIALKQKGIPFEIFEGSDEFKVVGAGIWLGSNAMQVLQKLNLSPSIQKGSTRFEKIYIQSYTGKILQEIDGAFLQSRFGFGTHGIHRAALQRILTDYLDEPIHLGHRLQSITQDDKKVHLKFDNGQQSDFDLVIGADGIRSVVRETCVQKASYRYSGQACWRAIASLTLPPADQNNGVEIWGKPGGLRASYSQISNEKVYFWATKKTQPDLAIQPEKSLVSLKNDLKSFTGPIQQVINNIKPENLIYSDLYDFKPIKDWSRGRVVLIGDAAHAMTPNLGQGASQAIEDAYILANELSKHLNDYPTAFSSYQARRRPKAIKVVDTSYKFGQLSNVGGTIGWPLKLALMRLTPSRLAIKQFNFLYDVNV